MNRITSIVWASTLLLVAACPTDPPGNPTSDATDVSADVSIDTGDTGDSGGSEDADTNDGSPPLDVPLVDSDTSPPDVPVTGCSGGCEEGETCISGNCIASCGDVDLAELLADLAPGIDPVTNICVDTAPVWAWEVGLDGAMYEVRANSEGSKTSMVLNAWNWWDGAESAAAATTLDSAVANGTIELWQVFPGQFLDLNAGKLLWGYAVGATGGEMRQVKLAGGETLQIATPGIYGAAQFSALLLATANGVQAVGGGPGGYYYHLVHQLGGPVLSGLGNSVGLVQVHKNDVMLASGYSNAWAECGGQVPVEPLVGQRTYALGVPLLAALFSNQELPVDLLCDAQVVDIPADFAFLADGRIATKTLDTDFEVIGLSVNYWTMSVEAQFLKGNAVPITTRGAFSELRADPHSTQLVLRHVNGYLVVEGPPTQDPVVPTTPVEPDAGPETAPEQVEDVDADVGGQEVVGADIGSELSTGIDAQR